VAHAQSIHREERVVVAMETNLQPLPPNPSGVTSPATAAPLQFFNIGLTKKKSACQCTISDTQICHENDPLGLLFVFHQNALQLRDPNASSPPPPHTQHWGRLLCAKHKKPFTLEQTVSTRTPVWVYYKPTFRRNVSPPSSGQNK
jgi:hypothetical protein